MKCDYNGSSGTDPMNSAHARTFPLSTIQLSYASRSNNSSPMLKTPVDVGKIGYSESSLRFSVVERHRRKNARQKLLFQAVHAKAKVESRTAKISHAFGVACV